MPKRKRTRGKLRARKRRRTRRRKTRIPRSGMLGFKHTHRLKYATRVVIDPNITASHHVFSANGLYDPDITGTGHQPLGFDQLMTFYDHYQVIGAKITVDFISTNQTGADVSTYICGVDLRDSTTVNTDPDSLMEQGTASYRVCTTSNANQKVRVRKGFSQRKFFTNVKVGNRTYQGTSLAQPGEQAYFHVFVAPIGAINSAAMTAVITIDYLAVFTEPKPIVGS